MATACQHLTVYRGERLATVHLSFTVCRCTYRWSVGRGVVSGRAKGNERPSIHKEIIDMEINEEQIVNLMKLYKKFVEKVDDPTAAAMMVVAPKIGGLQYELVCIREQMRIDAKTR